MFDYNDYMSSCYTPQTCALDYFQTNSILYYTLAYDEFVKRHLACLDV